MRPTRSTRSRILPWPPRNLRVSKLVCRGEIPNRNLAIALTNLRRLCLKHQESQDHIKEVYEYVDRFRDGSQEATPTIKNPRANERTSSPRPSPPGEEREKTRAKFVAIVPPRCGVRRLTAGGYEAELRKPNTIEAPGKVGCSGIADLIRAIAQTHGRPKGVPVRSRQGEVRRREHSKICCPGAIESELE